MKDDLAEAVEDRPEESSTKKARSFSATAAFQSHEQALAWIEEHCAQLPDGRPNYDILLPFLDARALLPAAVQKRARMLRCIAQWSAAEPPS